MKIAKLALTVALLLFVGATVGMLVAQEITHPPAVATETAPEIEAPVAETESPEPTAVLATDPPNTTLADTPSVAAEEDPEPAAVAAPGSACIVDAIYFHNTARCWTCKKIESTAKETLEAAFAEELAEGRLRWSAINMEKERHYVEQYSLVKPTLVLVRTVDGQPQDWVALDEAWSLIRYEARFTAYIDDSARAFLEGCP